jgi:ABC-type multidrug transport system fused ATPase/permease subunit
LDAILGELECSQGVALLSRDTSYSPQESWILHGSVETNILFGYDRDDELYNR